MIKTAQLEIEQTKDGSKSIESNNEIDSSNETDSNNESSQIGYFQLFRFATKWEIFLLFWGLIFSIIKATAVPAEIIIYSEFTSMLVDRSYATEVTSKTYLLPFMGGGKILTNASRDENNAELYNDSLAYGGLLMIVTISLFISGIFAVDIFNYVALKQITRMRIQFFTSTIRQDIGWHDVTKNQNVALRITDEIEKIRDGISEKISHFLILLIAFIITTVTAFAYGWKLSLAACTYIPIALLANFIVTKYQSKLTTLELNSYAKAGSLVEEILSCIRTVISFGAEKFESKKYDDYLVDVKKTVIRKGAFTGLSDGVLHGLVFLSSAAAFWYGVNLILADRYIDDKEYTPAILLIVVFGIFCGANNLGRCSPFLESFATARGSASTIYKIIESTSKIDPLSIEGIIPTSQIIGDIEFQDIFFSYPSRDDLLILKGINIKVESGKTIALVGSSGCGKSTCIQLIQRFYDPVFGKILLDDINIKSYNISWLRSQIAVVGQEPVLFQGTIGENIKYGKPNATKIEIEEAAKDAGAHDFIIQFPNGYKTFIGEKGTQLSGGQKQRIAIARALIQNPKILLLDEATSALDYKSEKLVQDALDVASKDRTTIVVSHRLSAIKGADKILFIEHGRVIEEGSPEDLIKLNGRYKQMVTASQLNVQDEGDSITDARKHNYQEPLNLNSTKIELDEYELQHFSEFNSPTKKDNDKFDNLLKNIKYREVFSRILKLARPERLQIICAIICSFIFGAVYPFYSIYFAEFYAALAEPDAEIALEKARRLTLYFVAVGIGTVMVCFMQMYLFISAGAWLTARIRSLVFSSILRQDVSWFDSDKNSVGSLSARLSGDSANIQAAIGSPLSSILQGLSQFILSLAAGWYYSWELTLICIALLPLMVAANVIEGKFMETSIIQEKEALEEASRVATEAINNIRTVAALRREKQIIEQYTEEMLRVEEFLRFKLRYRGLVNSFGNSLLYLGYAITFSYGGILVSKEEIIFQDIIKVSELLIFGAIKFAQSLAFTPALTSGLIASHRLFQMIDLNPQITSNLIVNKSASDKENKLPEVKYEGIKFSYPTRPKIPILEGLDLKIAQGKTVALVGHSGCGKSTCIQLLQRFYDPDDGKININEDNIKTDMTLESLRSNLGIVSQEPVLFERTIAENIAYGDINRTVSLTEIIDASKQANAHSFIIALPLGYETSLGAGGTQLSGGQKQRIAIARALIRNPKILLLDEATSALDLKSEKIVQSALDVACSGRTCIVIAHRLSTIQNADLICVVENGKVVEQGNHQQLLAKNGIYKELYKLNENNSTE